ncbi:MAG TPA: hypothetical protein VFI02_07975, partial [Armatimonadota bacterium]|nr:hypothetical protein [Armatimonadota bacterium]
TFGVIYDSVNGGGSISVHNVPSESSASNLRTVSLTEPLKSINALFLKINDTGTGYTFSFSGDGQNFIQLHSENYVSLMFTDKADQIGIFANANNAASYDAICTLLHWGEIGADIPRHYGFWGKGSSQSDSNANYIGIFGR